VSALSKRIFMNDTEVTDEILKEKLFAGIEKEFEPCCERIAKVLVAIAQADMDSGQAERHLQSQSSKPGGVSADEVQALIKFWKKERSSIHDQLVKKSCWNASLSGMSWRLDVLTKSRHVVELSNPAVIMEMKIDKIDEAAEVVRFEMGAEQVGDLIAQVDNIEAQIKALTAK